MKDMVNHAAARAGVAIHTALLSVALGAVGAGAALGELPLRDGVSAVSGRTRLY
jgi:hypothetical protein